MSLTGTYLRVDNRHIVYDHQFSVTPEWFDLIKLQHIAQLSGLSECGRSRSVFFKFAGQEYMLKHYWRGGMAAHFLRDRYLYTGSRRVNVFREWQLLHQLQQWQLPAPKPCAVSYIPKLMFYTADIILASCRPARPISALLHEQSIQEKHWQLIGKTIRRFHDKNVFHADLNANNILLLPQEDQVFLVDFDHSFITKKKISWRRAISNLDRLLRSFKKLQNKHGDNFHYHEDDFLALVDAYRGN